MRAAIAIACLSCLLSLPASAQDTYGLQQRIDDLEMRLNDLELSRLPPPQRFQLPLLDPDIKPLPTCRPGSICTQGLLLEPSRQTLSDIRRTR